MHMAISKMAASTESLFDEHNFQETVCEDTIHFKILKMKDSLFIWIGSTPNFDLMTISMPTKMSQVPASTTILGEDTNNLHTSLTQRLAKRTKKQILLSLNVALDDDIIRIVERRIIQEFNKYPEKF
eukprot:Seg562.9 transcript_id=Seg562.9/GoldUCD/mRNA.D3Y31 product="Proteasome assembly chaperone 4" protein_id=Seg562.9/GoldUCD/D3Y31